jgi:hypothetical protein
MSRRYKDLITDRTFVPEAPTELAAWTVGRSNPIKFPTIVIATSNSTKVNLEKGRFDAIVEIPGRVKEKSLIAVM